VPCWSGSYDCYSVLSDKLLDREVAKRITLEQLAVTSLSSEPVKPEGLLSHAERALFKLDALNHAAKALRKDESQIDQQNNCLTSHAASVDGQSESCLLCSWVSGMVNQNVEP